MRLRSCVLLAAAHALGGCHLLFPFEVDPSPSPDGRPDSAGLDARRDAQADASSNDTLLPADATITPDHAAAGVAVNALWPRTAIATAAVKNILGGEALVRASRRPEIMADAAHVILTRPSRACTGNFFIDEDLLRAEGASDAELAAYAVEPGAALAPDFFL